MPRARHLVNLVDYLRGTATRRPGQARVSRDAPTGRRRHGTGAAAIPCMPMPDRAGEAPVAHAVSANSWDSRSLRLFPDIATAPARNGSLTRTSTHLR